MISAPAIAALVVAIDASGATTGGVAQAATTALPELLDDVLSALPPPPDRVYLETRTYGTVMVDHRAHLARRVSCRTCHGPGLVSSIAFTPRSAHDSCRRCHETTKRGPTACRDCHVQSTDPPPLSPGERVRFVSRGARGERVASATSSRTPVPTAAPPGVAVATRSPAEQPRLVPGAEVAAFSAEHFAEQRSARFRSSREVAFAVAMEGGEPCIASAVRLAMRADNVIVTEALQWTAGNTTGRMSALLGGGFRVPLRSTVDVNVLALGGLDMRYTPVVAFTPVLGAGVEVQWALRTAFLRTIGLGLDATSSIGPTADASGGRTGGVSVSMGLIAALGRTQ